ncbi:hypothetical protein [Lacinutrix sp. Hel_I_90]|uniref:hypothetical protein n=1 Tax=Lacinutrix sp. Hel_I_90 TaxID=1249999 RepID=UPI0005C97AB0|nr:hypothetical protein [Lacinutrix sp. Hel_I_90]
MSNTHRLSKDSYLSLSGNNLNYYEVTGRGASGEESGGKETFSDWSENTLDIGEFKVIPFGKANDIPNQIQDAVLPNSFAQRSLKRKVELLIEQGPYLYELKQDGTKYLREPVEDQKLQDWLENINHEELLHANSIDYYFQESTFNKIFRSKQGRLNTSSPAAIEHVSAFSCRLAYKKNDKRKKPTHVIVGDWVKQDKKEMVVYPLYDPKEPGKYPVSIFYKKFATYGMLDYPLPDIYGSLEWIKNTTNTPRIFNAFIENSLNIKWHIQSPSKYWDEKRDILKQNCQAENKIYKEQMLEDLKTEILDSLSSLLSGVDNVGKFWHNEYVITLIGANAVELGWKITPIEQKTKEWVESQIKMYDTAKFAMQAGVGLHASLLMVGADGKSDSGSEQLNAYIIHQKTATSIPEYYVCNPINHLLKVIFKTNVKVGFYRTTPERQQDITNGQRLIPTTAAKTPQE